ncbi:hypothetical protein Hanom_Chr12g01065701 [Helianthus anomalus]
MDNDVVWSCFKAKTKAKHMITTCHDLKAVGTYHHQLCCSVAMDRTVFKF